MKMKQHPIEMYWLKFRKKNLEFIGHCEHLYENNWEAKYGPRDRAVAGIPSGVIEPVLVMTQHIQNGVDKESLLEESRNSIVGELGDHKDRMDFIQTTAAMLAYRADKTIYHIDRTLYDGLKETKFPDNFRTQNLVLPARACVFQIGENSRTSIIAFFDKTTPENGPAETVFKLTQFDSLLEECKLMFALVIREKETLQEALENHIEFMRVRSKERDEVREQTTNYRTLLVNDHILEKQVEDYKNFLQEQKEKLTGYINCILYAAGNEDTVEIIGHQRKISKDVKKQKRFRDLAKQNHLKIGEGYRRLIKKFATAQENIEQQESVSTGKKRKPHIRAGHAHTYWKNHPTKKGEKMQVVYFLPPLPIGYKWNRETETLVEVDLG
jgi:hypothetical protein